LANKLGLRIVMIWKWYS